MNAPWLHIVILIAFMLNAIGVGPFAFASDFVLPKPGIMVNLSPAFAPPVLKGIKVHPDNPFRFEFILDQGQGDGNIKEESTKLIKYFLASLTIPEKDLWVNLSPYEKDRIIPNSFGLTEMGRDLLAEDYMLKQITASLIYPQGETGKKFWAKIYAQAAKKFGTTNIPVNTFNKVWILPYKAVVYENAQAGTAYVVESRLKVMLEQDYLSLQKHEGAQSQESRDGINGVTTNELGSHIVREIVIPELTREVNQNKNFAQLRQVYNSLILATWYKKKIKDSILEQVYEDKNKIAGVNINDPQEKQKIYERYLEAFKKGVYNYIKEEQDPITQELVPRKYFSGGESFYGLTPAVVHDPAMLPNDKSSLIYEMVDFKPANQLIHTDTAMLVSNGATAKEIIGKNLSLSEEQEHGFRFAAHDKDQKNTRISRFLRYDLREEQLNSFGHSLIELGSDGSVILKDNPHALIPAAVLYYATNLLSDFPKRFKPKNGRYFNVVIQSSGDKELAGIEEFLVGIIFPEDFRNNPETYLKSEHSASLKTWYRRSVQNDSAFHWASPDLYGDDQADLIFTMHKEKDGFVIKLNYHGKPLDKDLLEETIEDTKKFKSGQRKINFYYRAPTKADWFEIDPHQKTLGEVQDYVDAKIKDVFKDLIPVLGDKVSDFVELVFDLEPKRFKDIDLQEIVLRKFYLQSQEEPILGRKPREAATLDPTEILDRLYNYLTSQGVDWELLPLRIKNKAISFAFDISQRKWKAEFGQDRISAFNKLVDAIDSAKANHNYLLFEVLNQIRQRNNEINGLEREIAGKGILKGLYLSPNGRLNRQGPQLEYYQLDNILRMRQEKKVILADDPGLGKTIQVLVYALLENSQEIFISVGPLLAKESFKRDLDKWINWKIDFIEVTKALSPQDKENLLLRKSPRAEGTQARLQLWRFDDLPKVVKDISEIPPFDFVGLDEAHWIKNNESQRSRAAQLLKANHVVLATATPVDNHVEDLRVLSKMVLNLEDGSIPEGLGEFLKDDANFLRLFSSKRVDTISLLRSLIKRKLIRNRISDVRGNIRDVKEGVLSLDIKEGFMNIRGDDGEVKRVDLKTVEERATHFDTFLKQRELYARIYRWVQQKGNAKFRLTGVNVLRHVLSDVRGVVDNVRKDVEIDGGEEFQGVSEGQIEEGELEGVSKRKNSELYNYIKSSVEELDREYPAQAWIGIKERMLERINSEFKGQKILVLVGFKGSLAEYQKILGNQNTGVIAGDVSQKDRVSIQRGFSNGGYQHVITTYGTGGVAADFSPADVLLLETPPAKGSERRQALGRVERVNDQGLTFEHPLHFYDAVVETWQDNLRSADEHYQRLNRYKELLALMLEDGVITKEVVDELNNIDKEFLKGFFSLDAAMTAKQAAALFLPLLLGSSIFMLFFGDKKPENPSLGEPSIVLPSPLPGETPQIIAKNAPSSNENNSDLQPKNKIGETIHDSQEAKEVDPLDKEVEYFIKKRDIDDGDILKLLAFGKSKEDVLKKILLKTNFISNSVTEKLIKEKGWGPILINIATQDPDPDVRVGAAKLIEPYSIDILSYTNELPRLLMDSDIRVRVGILETLNRMLCDNKGNVSRIRVFYKQHPDLFRQMQEDVSKHPSYTLDALQIVFTPLEDKIDAIIDKDDISKKDVDFLLATGKSKQDILRYLIVRDTIIPDTFWVHKLLNMEGWDIAAIDLIVGKYDFYAQEGALDAIHYNRPDLFMNHRFLEYMINEQDESYLYRTEYFKYLIEFISPRQKEQNYLRDYFQANPSLFETLKGYKEEPAMDLVALVNKDMGYALSLLASWNTNYKDEYDAIDMYHMERMVRSLLAAGSTQSYEEFQSDFVGHLISFLDNLPALDQNLKEIRDLLIRSRKLDIKFSAPLMFDRDTLRQLLDQREHKVKDNYQDYIVIFWPSADHNGFFTQPKHAYISEALKHHQRVLLYQVDGQQDMLKAEQDVYERGGVARVLEINGHGEPYSMDLGLSDIMRGRSVTHDSKRDSLHEIDSRSGAKFFGTLFKRIVDSHTVVLLKGCSVAGQVSKGSVNLQDSIINSLRKIGKKGVKVFASKVDVNRGSYITDFIYDGLKVIDVIIRDDIKKYIIERQAFLRRGFFMSNYATLPLKQVVGDKSSSKNAAMIAHLQGLAEKGGIDLTPANGVLQTQNAGQSIKFHMDTAQLAQLQNASGFIPVIITIKPMLDLRSFLGVNAISNDNFQRPANDNHFAQILKAG